MTITNPLPIPVLAELARYVDLAGDDPPDVSNVKLCASRSSPFLAGKHELLRPWSLAFGSALAHRDGSPDVVRPSPRR